MQTLLLALYNLEAGDDAPNPKTYSFRIPNIAQPSIYHDVMSNMNITNNIFYLLKFSFIDVSNCVFVSY